MIHCIGYSFVSGVKWWTHVLSMVINRSKTLLYCGEIKPNTRLKHPLDCFRCRASNPFAHGCLIIKVSVNLLYITPVDMPMISAHSRNLNPRPFNAILWIFVPREDNSISRLIRRSPSQIIRPNVESRSIIISIYFL